MARSVFVDAQVRTDEQHRAPVVPIKLASNAPSASNPVFTVGVERPVILMCTRRRLQQRPNERDESAVLHRLVTS